MAFCSQPLSVSTNQAFTGVIRACRCRVRAGVAFFVREFAKNVIRFVEQDQTCCKGIKIVTMYH